MTRGFTTKNVRLGHSAAAHSKRADAVCTTTGFYTSPSSGQTIDATSALNVSWIASCVSTSTVTIYLIAPGESTPQVQEWANVPNAAGSYMATLDPSRWNSSSATNMQLTIVPSGTPSFMSPAPAGPVFIANPTNSTSSTKSSSTSKSSNGITDVQKIEAALKGMSPGAKAAAVLLPLLFIIGLGVTYYLKIVRKNTQEKTKRFSTAIDKRMSTMSVDWKPMSAAGANAAIRASMAGSHRASVFSFGNLRPSSEMATDGGHAGIGSAGIGAGASVGIYGEFDMSQQMSQLRSGPRPISAAASQSRKSVVSFATDTRPSLDRRTVVSRAYHNAFVPPVPTRQDSGDLPLSPTQTHGPFSLSQDDITARVSGSEQVDDYMPALNMMRTGGESMDAADYIIPRTPPQENTALPIPPTPTHAKPAPAMTPDEMLRQYAADRTQFASPPGSPAPAFPSPVFSNNGMRVLYSPVTPSVPLTPVSVPGSVARDMHHAYAYSEDAGENHEDAYGGTAH